MTDQERLAKIEPQLAKLRMPAGYYNAGIPNFNHLFGRDACISALQLLHRDPEVARATLETLVTYQGNRLILRREEYPGRILHEHYPNGWRQKLADFATGGDRLRQIGSFIVWRFPYYGSIDVGAWFLILLHHYYDQTKDEALVRQLWPHAMAIIGWYDKHATRNHLGLVGFRRHYIFGLRNQSWKDNLNLKLKPPVAMVEVQGYYYYALRLLADLAESVIGEPHTAVALRQRAERLHQTFRTHFVPVDGTFPLAVDRRGRPYRHATSNPGQLLFTGILTPGEVDQVVERLSHNDLMTPYGIRTESTKEPTFAVTSYQNGAVWPFDNWVIHQGMLKTGHHGRAKTLRSGVITIFDQWDIMPETYAVGLDHQPATLKSSCRIQAWSAGALINWLDQPKTLL